MWKPEWHTTSGQPTQDTLGWPTSLVHLLPPNWPLDVPLARITTCGCSPLSIEVLQGFQNPLGDSGEPLSPIYAPLTPQQWNANGGKTALVLLEILTSQPSLVASQDLLAQALRPTRRSAGASDEEADEDDSSEDRALKRPENVVTLLRRLLYPPALAHLPQADQRAIRNALIMRVKASTDSGPAYRLAGLPLLWIDVEAMEAYYQRIPILTQFGENVQDAWQAICELGLRGQFLPHERYSDWVQWRRSRVRDLLWQSVDAQVKAMMQWEDQESGEEASLRLLTACWQAEPANEDVFRTLTEKLGKRERFQQAEEYYAQLCLALEREGHTPHKRTNDVMEFVRAKHIQRAPAPIQKSAESTKRFSLPFSSFQERDTSFDFSLPVTPDMLEAIRELESVAHLNPSRRDFLHALLRVVNTAAVLPASASAAFASSFFLDTAQPPGSEEALLATLERFTTLTDICQRLSEGNEMPTAERLLWSYLPRVETITKHSFAYEQQAAEIASQGYLLAASLAGHRNDLQARHHLSEQALLYGKLAQNRNRQVVALRQLAITFDYFGSPEKVLQIYQQALPYLDEVSPLLRACIYADISGASTQLHRQYDADKYLNMAYACFPEDSTHEPAYLSTICRYSTLVLCRGLNHLAFGQAQDAEQVFAQLDGLHPKSVLPERIRIDVLNCQVETFLALKKRDEACAYLEASAQTALEIRSERRLQEALLLFQQMQQVWPHDSRVRQLAPFFGR